MGVLSLIKDGSDYEAFNGILPNIYLDAFLGK